MALFTKNDSTSKIETELARLEKRKATLIGKLEAAKKAEAAAREAQRQHLLSDDENPQTAAKIAADVARASADVIAIADALSTVDGLIAEGRAAAAAARESAARARRASEIQERITKLEPMIASAESLFEKLADVLAKIVELADDRDLVLREYRVIHGPGSPLSAATLTGAALTEALFRSLPDGFAVTKMPTATYAAASLPLMTRRDGGLSVDLPLDTDAGPGFRPLPLSGALSSNLIEPLRTAAAEILSGSRPLANAEKIIADDIEAGPVFEHRTAVLTRPIKWRDAAGNVCEHADSSADLPEPVIIAAKSAGVAFDNGTPEAAAQLEARFQRGVHHPSLKLSKSAAVELRVTWPKTTRAAA